MFVEQPVEQPLGAHGRVDQFRRLNSRQQNQQFLPGIVERIVRRLYRIAVTTRKVGRVRTCTLGPRRLEDETAWIERQRRLWDERFDELERIVGERRRKEQIDGRAHRA